MQTTSFAAALVAAGMLNASALALRLNSEAATTTATTTTTATNTALQGWWNNTVKSAVTLALNPETFYAFPVPQAVILNKIAVSAQTTTADFILDEEDETNSKVRFTTKIEATEPDFILSEICFDNSNGEEQCMKYRESFDGRNGMPEVGHDVFLCLGHDTSGWCNEDVRGRDGGDISAQRWRKQNDGSWERATSSGSLYYFGDRPEDFTGHEWSHDPDTGVYKYDVEILLKDLPDWRSALQTLKAGQAVDLPFRIYVEKEDESELIPGWMWSELKVAPAPTAAYEDSALASANATLYSHADCKEYHYGISNEKGTSSTFAAPWFDMTYIKIEPGYFVQTVADWTPDKNWLSMYSVDGNVCQQMDQEWLNAPNIQVHHCRQSEFDSGICAQKTN